MNHKWWRSSQWLFPSWCSQSEAAQWFAVRHRTRRNDQKKKGHPTVPMLTESRSDGQQGPKTIRGVHLGEVLSTNSPSHLPLLPPPTRRWVYFCYVAISWPLWVVKDEMQKCYWPFYRNALWSFRVWAIYHVGSFFFFFQKEKETLFCVLKKTQSKNLPLLRNFFKFKKK